MKILLHAPIRGQAWMGGVHYFQGLVSALALNPPEDGTQVWVATNDPACFHSAEGKGVRVVHAPWLDPGTGMGAYLNAGSNVLLQYNPRLGREARRIGADVVTHATPAIGAPCPILFWMPDFQHRHLPSYFSRYERWRRDRNVRASARHGHILFSSQSAVADFRLFYPGLAERVSPHVLRFPAMPPSFEPVFLEDLRNRYGVPARYFFLPNQFWRHKNHTLVVKALERTPPEVQVVCTGAVMDSRGNAHIRELEALLDAGSLRSRFRMLGVVPRNHMLSLLQHSIALVNPSLFEGWSTVVEEARLAGKRMLLSDIPVHREQSPEGAAYFDPADPDQLAGLMQALLEPEDPRSEAHRRQHATQALPGVVRIFAQDYRRIAAAASRGRSP